MAMAFAVKYLYKNLLLLLLLLLLIPFLYFFFFKSGIDKSTKWSTIPACPSFMCFLNRGNTEGTNASKISCLTFVYVLCKFM